MSKQNTEGFGIGSPIWIQDCHRRVQHVVTGETTRSWIYGDRYDSHKLSKKDVQSGELPSGVYVDKMSMMQREWCAENRYNIGQLVHRLNDYATLVSILKLIDPDLRRYKMKPIDVAPEEEK
jgi:hypothetical protein